MTSMHQPIWMEPSLRAIVNPDVALPVRVRSVTQTSCQEPSQWEGRTATGKLVLVRFRHGQLWIGLTPDFMTTPVTVLQARTHGDGDDDDGYLTFETLRRITAGVVEWP
jgi:hypothetical protein